MLVLWASGLLLIPVASAHAANNVLPPPPVTFVPDRGGASAGAPCGGTVLCVGPSGAYPTIAAAVAAAPNGDTIQVEAGTYPERVTVSGKTLTLRGGFAAGFATRNPAANPTVIDGQGGGTTVALSNAGASTIDGFTITGGRAPLDGRRSPRVRDQRRRLGRSHDQQQPHRGQRRRDELQLLQLRNVRRRASASAASVPGSSVNITGNIVRNNRALRGAGMSIGVRAVIEGNLVENNHAGGDHGGGLYLSAQTMTVRRNLIRDNVIGDQAGYGWGGGAIFYGPGKPTPKASFESNRWVGNGASGSGSALFIDEDASATITGDLFHGNACGAAGCRPLRRRHRGRPDRLDGEAGERHDHRPPLPERARAGPRSSPRAAPASR